MARQVPKMRAVVRKLLVSERDRLLTQSAAMTKKIERLDLAIELLKNDEAVTSRARFARRGNAKAILLGLLREVGANGLNAASAVDMAKRLGLKIEPGTAASYLSRMNTQGVVIRVGKNYRLPEFVGSYNGGYSRMPRDT
jgi:hypothetical protein